MQTFGILDKLLNDSSISEIMVNGKSKVYIERSGKLELSDLSFEKDDELYQIIESILKPLGRTVSFKQPFADARLPDGSRVNIVIPPLSLIGPMITIRKFSKKKLEGKDLVSFGSLNQNMLDFLNICVKSRKNILISGGTGSGKTSILNILSSAISSDERILTIEDAAELALHQEHVGRLESRPADHEGKNEITIRQLLINALRMRPDRIIVGECRGAEALDMLQAMNTGHDGSLTTVHANNPRDALKRLEIMVLMAGIDLPLRAIREQISSAINIIVQTLRFRDGSRKISEISQVTGIEGEVLTLSPIFKFKEIGFDTETSKIKGEFISTGNVPTFIEEITAKGFKLDMKVFSN